MSELVFNVAFALFVGASWLRNELWLRLGLMASCVLSATFGFLIESPSTMAWNIAFVVVSAFRVTKLLRADRAISLSVEEDRVHARIFAGFTRAEFLRVWEVGVESTVDELAIVTEGRPVDELVLVLDGTLHVSRGDQVLAELGAGQFVGEVAFATNAPASATVRPGPRPTRCRVWSAEMLRGLLRTAPEIGAKLERVLNADLAAKLVSQTQVSVS